MEFNGLFDFFSGISDICVWHFVGCNRLGSIDALDTQFVHDFEVPYFGLRVVSLYVFYISSDFAGNWFFLVGMVGVVGD